MRVTKKLLREMKAGMMRRLRELSQMSDEQLLREHQRCFPHLPEDQRPAFASRQLWELVSDCVERSIPGHWCD